jgi:serine phosphatase RsbU (regulator of sigma subunit)
VATVLVLDSDRALFLVIGDVAGHGPGSVAIMAQVLTPDDDIALVAVTRTALG